MQETVILNQRLPTPNAKELVIEDKIGEMSLNKTEEYAKDPNEGLKKKKKKKSKETLEQEAIDAGFEEKARLD